MTQTANPDQPVTEVEKTVEKPVKETGKTVDTLFTHLLEYAERLTKMEQELPRIREDLSKQVNELGSDLRKALDESRQEQHRLAEERMTSIEGKLDKLEKALNDALAGDEKEPRTRVDQVHQEHDNRIPPQLPEGAPAQIVPPTVATPARGIRGRRHARRGQRNGE